MTVNATKLLFDAASRQPGNYIEVSVPELLGCWGYRVRDYDSVPHIEGELTAAGLITESSFAEAARDAMIRLVPADASTTAPAEPEEPTEIADVEEFIFPSASLLVRDIPSATAGLVFVSPRDSIADARSQMMANDCDQVAVLAAPNDLRGAVTWSSLAKAAIAYAHPTLKDATHDAERVKLDGDLLTQLPRIYAVGFAFVCDDEARVCGVVTATGLSQRFETLVRPFFLIGEIERRLRRRADERFSYDDLQAVATRRHPVHSAKDLTLGGYVMLLDHDERWRQLDWHCTRAVFVPRLKDVRQMRNAVMHFDADPLTDDQLTTLENFAKLVRTLDPRP